MDSNPHAPPQRAFQVQIKRGSKVLMSFPAMGPDSLAVAADNECLCGRGEYVLVRPAKSAGRALPEADRKLAQMFAGPSEAFRLFDAEVNAEVRAMLREKRT